MNKSGLKYRINKFLYSDYYIIVVALLIFLAWLFNFTTIALCILTIVCSLIVLFKKDVAPILPITLMFLFAVSDSNVLEFSVVPFSVVLSIFFVSIIIHIIRFQKQFKFGKLFYSLIAVSSALLLGGVNFLSAEQYISGLLFAFSLGVLMLLIYSFFINNLEINEDYDIKKYLAKTLMIAGLILTGQVINFFIHVHQPIIKIIGASMPVGWGICNTIAITLLLFFPAAFYLGLTEKRFKIIYYLIGILEFITILFTFSRGGILFGSIAFIVCFIYCLCKEKQKGYAILPILITIAVFLILLLIYQKTFLETFKSIMWQGSGSSGRDELYLEAWQNFLAHPFFGVGLGYNGNNFTVPNNYSIYWYHSTIFQVMASLGALGIVAYLWFYIERILIMVETKNNFSMIMIFAILGFEGYSMIDVGMFIAFPTVYIVLIITLIVELTCNKNMKIIKNKKYINNFREKDGK